MDIHVNGQGADIHTDIIAMWPCTWISTRISVRMSVSNYPCYRQFDQGHQRPGNVNRIKQFKKKSMRLKCAPIKVFLSTHTQSKSLSIELSITCATLISAYRGTFDNVWIVNAELSYACL